MSPRVLLSVLVLTGVLMGGAPVQAQRAPDWVTVPGGSELLRAAYWEDLSGAVLADGAVRLAGRSDSTPVVHSFGPRINAQTDFRVQLSLQPSSTGLAVLGLADVVPEEHWWPGMRRVEFGFDAGHIVVGTFDGASEQAGVWQQFEEVASGPVTFDIVHTAGEVSVQASGRELVRLPDAGLFPSGRAVLAMRIDDGNSLTLQRLLVHAPREVAADVRVERCAPDRLLFTGSDADDVNTGMWWLNLAEPTRPPRQIEASSRRAAFMVAVSPDARWAAYYQRTAQQTDRFIVDSWVVDLATDERSQLVEGNAPLGWAADSSGIILRERPSLTARVPSGELIDTSAQLATPDAMLALNSPDGQYRAVVSQGGQGAPAGLEILSLPSRDPYMTVTASRGAVMLAWSPDGSRLAFTSAQSGPFALLWRLRIVDVATKRVWAPESVQDMQIHSVVWAPALPGCS